MSAGQLSAEITPKVADVIVVVKLFGEYAERCWEDLRWLGMTPVALP
jgi:hypothetical protein